MVFDFDTQLQVTFIAVSRAVRYSYCQNVVYVTVGGVFGEVFIDVPLVGDTHPFGCATPLPGDGRGEFRA
jgi:hypothetical protein